MTTAPLCDRPLPQSQPVCSAAPKSYDADLSHVLRAKAGDSAAFVPLWDRHWRGLHAYFVRQVNNAEEAEDLASETLLAAFDQIAAFRGETETPRPPQQPDGGFASADVANCTFQTYVRAIARHKLAHWVRRKTTRPVCALADIKPAEAEDGDSAWEECLADNSDDPLATLLKQERLDDVCYALADVGTRSTEQFKALFLHYCCDLPHKEIASLLNTRNETINTRLQEGRRSLQRHYQPERLAALSGAGAKTSGASC